MLRRQAHARLAHKGEAEAGALHQVPAHRLTQAACALCQATHMTRLHAGQRRSLALEELQLGQS